VVDLAERLMGSGVWVVLDKWDLQPGQDAYAFMERMVTDPTVTKVLMVCDRAYVDKATARAGGVGVEAQILSPQLYRTGATNQTRIAAACRDRDDQGQPIVPVFYQSRIHFDFSRRDHFDQAYEDVLNWAFNRPRFVRPPLGRQLASVSDAVMPIIAPRAAVPPSTLAMQRASAFREARLDEISAGRTPCPLDEGAVAVLHMTPIPSFEDPDAAVDLVTMINNGAHMPVPLNGRGGHAAFNLHGVSNTLGVSGYGQLFRNGAYEGTHVLSVRENRPYIASLAFAEMVVGAARRGLALLAHYKFGFPTAVTLSLCNAKDVNMVTPTEFNAGFYEKGPFGHERHSFPTVMFGGEDVDVPAEFRSTLNAVWNAFGEAGCSLYDGQGRWRGKD
jgi:hypothetical protein